MDIMKNNLDNDINYHIAIIKQSLLRIKILSKDKHQAYSHRQVIINLTNNILFLFFNF
jgi:hypothetical protein